MSFESHKNTTSNRSEELSIPEKFSGITRVENYLASQHVGLIKEFENLGKTIPEGERLSIGSDFRLIPPKDRYTAEQQAEVARALTQIHGTSLETGVRKHEKETSGGAFEYLKTAIMHKNMQSSFMVVRSSRFDDVTNGVDNILVNRKTGDVICALDEVSPAGSLMTRDPRFAEKSKVILDKNLGRTVHQEGSRKETTIISKDCGAKLKYGPHLENGVLTSREVNNLPIFLLALDMEHLNASLEKFSAEKTDPQGDRLYKYFLFSIAEQIQRLKLFSKEYPLLPVALRKRVEGFESFLAAEIPRLK